MSGDVLQVVALMLIEVETSKTLLLHCHAVSEFHINCGCGMTFNITELMARMELTEKKVRTE